jgi:hypothetical protein
MSAWKISIIMSLMLLAFSPSLVVAEPTTQPEAIQQTKAELETLYLSWRKARPSEPLTAAAFNLYLTQLAQSQHLTPLVYNSFKDQLEIANWVLPNGAWILETYSPTTSNSIGLVIDINGFTPPNGHQFGTNSDQYHFEIAPSGHIELQ